jgi:hypothetical protein
MQAPLLALLLLLLLVQLVLLLLVGRLRLPYLLELCSIRICFSFKASVHTGMLTATLEAQTTAGQCTDSTPGAQAAWDSQ